MKKIIYLIIFCLAFPVFSPSPIQALSSQREEAGGTQSAAGSENGPVPMLGYLLELQRNLKEQIRLSQKKLEASGSETEKAGLQEEIAQLDRQLSESIADFERIATGVEPALFAEKKPATFSWKEELASLLEPAIKELKRFTIRARQKTDLKDKITELKLLGATAGQAVAHLQTVQGETADPLIRKEIAALQPEWQNIEKRLQGKLELAERELVQLEAQDTSLVERSSDSLRTFFRDRGLYLIVAVLVFFGILLGCRLLHRIIVAILLRLRKKDRHQSFRIRLLYIFFQVFSVVLAVVGMFLVLYLAEDWFLLSMAIIFFLGVAWTIRQGLPRLWQQGRLMLNVGAVRENERLILHGVPWKVESINVFCKLVNPSLGMELRLPIEGLTGLVSRPYSPDEPWFPCKKGDWVVVGNSSRARVVSLSHEQVEVVERGGRRITYPTPDFLQSCPANLSRNFRIRVIFGLSYRLQDRISTTIPVILKEYLEAQLETSGYKKSCLNLNVEFYQANASSLDLLILADFDGKLADVYTRVERSLQMWCVDCCTENDWEIPFPQLTVHSVK
jgi:hypothetical protein